MENSSIKEKTPISESLERNRTVYERTCWIRDEL